MHLEPSLTLDEARKLARNGKHGSYASDMMYALNSLGYKQVRLRENLTWLQLRALLPKNHVIVAWWTPMDEGVVVDPSQWDGHWSVVKRVTKQKIYFWDPDTQKDTEMPWQQFDILWRDYEVEADGYKRAFHHAAVVARKR